MRSCRRGVGRGTKRTKFRHIVIVITYAYLISGRYNNTSVYFIYEICLFLADSLGEIYGIVGIIGTEKLCAVSLIFRASFLGR